MQAARIHEYGDASVITIDTIDTPEPGENQVLVEVHAASLNPFDSMVRSGYLRESAPLELPVILGGDIAGIVTGVGGGVTSVKVGDRVYGQAAVVAGNSGAFAEYAVTSASQLAPAPQNLGFVEAAAMPLVGVSALQALSTHIRLKKGKKLLITGGSGGIGSIAIQIAKHLGANVTATATGESIEFAKELGADRVIDYKSVKLSELQHDYDAVYDTVGGETFADALHILKPGGIAVSMIGKADEALVKRLQITVISQMTEVATEALDTLRELIESKAVRPQVGKVFELADTGKAFRTKEGGEIEGKVVIRVRK